MPEAAIATGAVDRVVAVEEVAPMLMDLCGAGTPGRRTAA
jgi:chemotaxis response regulator CheB